MDTENLARRFWRDGYLILEEFFDAAAMEPLDGLIRAHFGRDPGFGHSDEFLDESQTSVIPWFPQNEGPGPFDALDEHAGLRAITAAVLGDGWRSDYCMVMYSKQGTSGQAWHQDCPPEHPARFNLNRLVYTDDIRDEIGGQVVVVPGSFRRGILPVGEPLGNLDDQVVLTPGKGTLVLLHGHCWHRVLPVTGGFRYSTNYRAAPEAAPDGITDVCVYRNMLYRFSSASIVERRV